MSRERIEKLLVSLGVQYAGRENDPRRWSVSDLATDLAEDLAQDNNREKVKLLLYLIEVAQKTEGAEVWRALFAEILAREDR